MSSCYSATAIRTDKKVIFHAQGDGADMLLGSGFNIS